MKRFELLKDETILMEQPIHWKNYLSSGTFLLLCTVLFIVRAFNPDACLADLITGNDKPSDASAVLGRLELISAGVLMVIFFMRAASVAFIRYYVTNRRIVATSGFFTIHTQEMLIERCETVFLRQSVYERAFGCADLLCIAPGSKIVLDDVTKAEAFKETIMKQLTQK